MAFYRIHQVLTLWAFQLFAHYDDIQTPNSSANKSNPEMAGEYWRSSLEGENVLIPEELTTIWYLVRSNNPSNLI